MTRPGPDPRTKAPAASDAASDLAPGPAPDPAREAPKNADAEADFTRKLVLGLISTLEGKGLLSKPEVDSILRVARHAAFPPPAPRPVLGGPALLGTKWVRPGEAPQPLDRRTPVAIPDVRLAAPAGAVSDRAPDRTDDANPEAEDAPAAPVPVIDMKME